MISTVPEQYTGTGRIQYVDVNPCDWNPEYGCQFVKGDFVDFAITVKPGVKIGKDGDVAYNQQNIKLKMWAKVGFFNDRFPHWDENVCDPNADPIKHTDCPFNAGQEKLVLYKDMQTPENFPSTYGTISIWLEDKLTRTIGACGRLNMRYKAAGAQDDDDDED